MTRYSDFYAGQPPDANRSGNWKGWWRAGCGSVNGVPVCPPGHAYYTERYTRKAHARSKVLGRRRQRRELNKLVDE
jgi:hypothetical protein